MTRFLRISCLLVILSVEIPWLAAEEITLNGNRFTLPAGFVIEQIAGPPLVDRPVSADFDERGRLYVTDSSGSNEPVSVQQEKRPHRIVRLTDNDGDGIFDDSTVYADRLMFPEGALWYDGSLYVAAPPEIWKFTDADDDGVAEDREVWFDGKTLTHCANDLHGPYLGPDGWMYWCKGAFAEQTHERAGQSPLNTRAAHIFRRHPAGGPLEIVMTGGMDNPVEVVFTPGGERIFSTTFLVHPTQGQRDGLIHAVYGGVYGKDHGAISGHPRTGALMPVLSHLGAAAPCGLTRLQSSALGRDFRDNVLVCSFNMHKITRHQLKPQGATFHSDTTDLLVSDHPDFHPTDVLEDSDGSVIVLDTGGWFRLCCPTSQLEKADVRGAVYRIRRADSQPGIDARGLKIAWTTLNETQLVDLLGDQRFAVREQATRQIARRGGPCIQPLTQVLNSSADPEHRLAAVWALTRIDDPLARTAVRLALADVNETVQQAAIHSVSVHRDRHAAETLTGLIQNASAQNRRAAAEALGRLGTAQHIANLMSELPAAIMDDPQGSTIVDRCLEHSLIYAAMELGDPHALRPFLTSDEPSIHRAALIALDQMEGGSHLTASDIQPLLTSENDLLNETAWWIAEQHPDWGDAVVAAFETELRTSPAQSADLARLTHRLVRFSGSPVVQKTMADALNNDESSESTGLAILQAMADSRQKPLPSVWQVPLLKHLSGSPSMLRATLTALNQLSPGPLSNDFTRQLTQIAADPETESELRLRAMILTDAAQRLPDQKIFNFVCQQLNAGSPITNRALAMDLLKSTPLTGDQLKQLAQDLPQIGAMELQPLLLIFAESKDPQVGAALVQGLLEAPSATALLPDRLQTVLSGFSTKTLEDAAPLLEKIERENKNKLERIHEILALLPDASVRRGLQVFQGQKASCLACHRRGYLGGDIGPDLNRIGQIRSERDLLESILFPSLSFVRSYEPVSIVTSDGRVFNGLIRDETAETLILQLDAQKSVRISKADIEERHAGSVSVMPAGLDKQLTPQDMADLVRYLREG